MTRQEAKAINELFDNMMRWLNGQSIMQANPLPELAKDAARFLAEQAYRKLKYGWCDDDIAKAWKIE